MSCVLHGKSLSFRSTKKEPMQATLQLEVPAQFSWAGLGSYGIYMRQEYFPDKPIERKRDFAGQ